MDRAGNIESQWYSPDWQRRGDDEHYKNVNWLNRFGTSDKDRLPMRSFAIPILKQSRQPPSIMKLNVHKSRYHHPGGLAYNKVDFARVLNSHTKITPSDNYIMQEIKCTPGFWHHSGK